MDFLVSVMALRGAVFAAAVKSGRPVEELATLVRVPTNVLTDPDARVSHGRVTSCWATLVKETGDSTLGLYAAQLIDSAATDRLQPLLAQAVTLGDSVQMFLRYQQLYHSGNASRSRLGPDAWILEFALHREIEPGPYLADFVLANWVCRMRRATNSALPVQQAKLRRPAPTDQTPYLELFGPNVHFDAAEDSLQFSPDAAALPIANSNPALKRILEEQANAELEGLDPDTAFLRDARAALEATLRGGSVFVEGLAKTLATSPRTLQRRLASSGTTFQELLDDVRHQLALGHLARGQSVTDTAFLLGFSELSAFSRAFRRWTGRAPKSYMRAPAG